MSSQQQVGFAVRTISLLVLSASILLIPDQVLAATYYVSSAGSDTNDGKSPETSWRTIGRVNAASIRPGDNVLLRRGDRWREQLVPHSGSDAGPVTYGAYGSGDKPLLLGSVPKNDPADWVNEGGNIWATLPPDAPLPSASGSASRPADLLPNLSFSENTAGWNLHTESGAAAQVARDTVEYDSPPASLRIQCAKSGTEPHHIQLYTASFGVKANTFYSLTFRARCTKPFQLYIPHLMKNAPPWDNYAPGTLHVRKQIDRSWTPVKLTYACAVTASDARLGFFLGGTLPEGAVFHLDSITFTECTGRNPLPCDVGNIILDDEASCGVKVFNEPELTAQGRYWYDEDRHVLKLHSAKNPASFYRSIECALTRHIINQSNVHHVVYENLTLKYGAAHGIGGGTTHHITVRDCDFGFIGGGDQMGGDRTVRYGNGIEFWGHAADSLVERCRLWEIYDAALTNQNSGPNVRQVNITYRNNIIWNSEYSFEYWNRPESSFTGNIRFENNTCFNAGYGWGHAQRPDPSGRHLCFYSSPAPAEGIVIRNNIFCRARTNAFYAPTWPPAAVAALVMDHNCWYQPEGVMILLKDKKYPMAQFPAYQSEQNKEPHSLAADPLLADPAKADFRLTEKSPCIDAGTDVGLKSDFHNAPVPQGPAPDIGALESPKR